MRFNENLSDKSENNNILVAIVRIDESEWIVRIVRIVWIAGIYSIIIFIIC